MALFNYSMIPSIARADSLSTFSVSETAIEGVATSMQTVQKPGIKQDFHYPFLCPGKRVYLRMFSKSNPCGSNGFPLPTGLVCSCVQLQFLWPTSEWITSRFPSKPPTLRCQSGRRQ